MTSHHSAVPPRPPWPMLAATLLALASCQPQGREAGPRPTPPPTFRSFAGASRADLLAYGRSLQFDTTRPAMVAQYLVVPRAGQLAVGPYVWLAPEIGAAAISRGAVAEGRIVARLTLTGPAPEAGLPGGVSYVWVDSTAAGLRTVLVPENDSVPLISDAGHTIPMCRDRSPTRLRAAAWLDEPPAAADSTRMIRCYPCDCAMCCSASLLRDLLSGPRGPGRAPLLKPGTP